MKLKYLCLIYLSILISLISFSIQNYQKSNLKKFLRNLGAPDIPLSNQFLYEPDHLLDNDANPSKDTDGGEIPQKDEKENGAEEEPEKESKSEEKKDSSDEKEDGQSEEEKENGQSEEEKEDGQSEEEKEDGQSEKEKEDGQSEEEKEDGQSEEEKEDGESEKEKEKEKDNTYVNIKCLWVAKYNVYTLQKLQKEDDYEVEFEKGKIIFNFCQDSSKYPVNKSTVLWERNDTDLKPFELIKLSGSIDGEKKNKNKWQELTEDEEMPGLLITLAHGDKCNDGYHQTHLKIFCDSNIDDDDFIESVNLTKFYNEKEYKCKHYIEVKSIYGCPLNNWYLLRRIMKKYRFLFGLGFMLIGVFLCMWGNKYKIPTIMVVLGLIFSYIISIIILNFIPSLINTEKKLWILLGIGFLFGCFIGYMIKAKIMIFTVLLGISMGYSVAEVIYLFLQGFIEWNPTYLYYSVMVVCCIGGIVVGYYLIKTVMILGTSLVGGYIFMRGVAVIFGNYFDEEEFADLIKNGEYEQIREKQNGWVYLYLAIWLGMTVFGFYYQCIGHKKKESDSDKIEKTKKKKGDDDDDEDDDDDK